MPNRFRPLTFASLLLGAICMIDPAYALQTCVVQTAETMTCREFQTMVQFNNEPEQSGPPAVACLQSSNMWKVVSGLGFGTSFYRNDNRQIAYQGGSYMVNGVLYQQPSRIRYIYTRKTACVPSMPQFYQIPGINTHPATPAAPATTPAAP
jgi:hypothetical protein